MHARVAACSHGPIAALSSAQHARAHAGLSSSAARMRKHTAPHAERTALKRALRAV